MKVSVVGKDKNLLDETALGSSISVVRIVSTYGRWWSRKRSSTGTVRLPSFSRTEPRLKSEHKLQGRKIVRIFGWTGFAAFLLRSWGIIKMCTPLLPKMHTPRPFVKRCYGRKCKKLCGNRFRSTAEPYIVKKYRKSLINQGLCKKKLNTNQDTHCIKIGVQLWCGWRDSNPYGRGPLAPQASQSTSSSTSA